MQPIPQVPRNSLPQPQPHLAKPMRAVVSCKLSVLEFPGRMNQYPKQIIVFSCVFVFCRSSLRWRSAVKTLDGGNCVATIAISVARLGSLIR